MNKVFRVVMIIFATLGLVALLPFWVVLFVPSVFYGAVQGAIGECADVIKTSVKKWA